MSDELPSDRVVECTADAVDLGGLFDLEDPGAPVPVAPVASLDSMESVETVDPKPVDLGTGTFEELDAENESDWLSQTTSALSATGLEMKQYSRPSLW